MKSKLLKKLFNKKSIIIAALILLLLPAIGLAEGNFISDAIVWILQPVVYVLGQLLVFLIDQLTFLFEYNNFLGVPVVAQGWVVVRDLLNMFFVLVMMAMAIGTILPFGGLEKYNYKNLMVKFLIAAITINFSKTILGVVIDACQLLMLQFVASFRESIAVNLADSSMLPEVLNYAKQADTGATAAVMAMIMAIIFLVVFIFVLTVYVAVLLYRIISLWVLIILSPIAFFAQTVPGMEKFASEFWSKFSTQVTVGVVLAFFMWLALTIIYMTDSQQSWLSGQGAGQADVLTAYNDQSYSSSDGSGKSVCASSACDYYKIFRFLVAIVILLMAMQYASQSGGAVGKFASKMSGKMAMLGMAAVGGFGAAKYLKGKGKDALSKTWNKTKALGATTWQNTAGRGLNLAREKIKNISIRGRKSGDLGVGALKTVGIGAATTVAALAGGPFGIGLAAAGYGLVKSIKNFSKKKKIATNAKQAAFRDARRIDETKERMYLDEHGAETTEDKAEAKWDTEKQAYIRWDKDKNQYKEKEITGYKKDGKEIYKGDADYDEKNYKDSSKENKLFKQIDDKIEDRQRFDTYKDVYGVERRFNDKTGNFEVVSDNPKGNLEAVKAKDGNEWLEKKERPSQWTASWRANNSRFGGVTDKARQEELEKGTAKFDQVDAESLKQILRNSGTSADDKKFAALSLARRGEELPADVAAIANKFVADDPYAKDQFGSAITAKGNIDQFKDAKGNIDVNKLAAAFKKGLRPDLIKASQMSAQVIEAMLRQFGNKSLARLNDIAGRDVSSKNAVNKSLLDFIEKKPGLGEDTAKGIYGRMTGNYIEGVDAEGKKQTIFNETQAIEFLQEHQDADVLANVTIKQLEVKGMEEALKKCENLTLFNRFFNNADISKTIKDKVAQILNGASDDFKEGLKSMSKEARAYMEKGAGKVGGK